ncbi:MAG TPA: hypothetical protein VF633_07955 [Brevundimonas sp.]
MKAAVAKVAPMGATARVKDPASIAADRRAKIGPAEIGDATVNTPDLTRVPTLARSAAWVGAKVAAPEGAAKAGVRVAGVGCSGRAT